MDKQKTNITNNNDELIQMWNRAKNACRTTVNKEHSEKEPVDKFKTKLLISEHSPIRLIRINWLWKNIKSWITVHFSRHSWECFISTQRTDRTGIDRDELRQSEEILFEGEMNAQNAIDTARKRLCYQSSKETREYMEDLKIELRNHNKELSDVLVPNCVYRCGCPEFTNCGFFDKYLKSVTEYYSGDYNLTNIKDRYLAYNCLFYKMKSNKEGK